MDPKLPRIYVAGQRGMVDSAIVRQLFAHGHPASHIIRRTHAQLNLTEQSDACAFFAAEKPDQGYLAAAKVGGIYANNAFPADFIYQNLMIQANVIESAFANDMGFCAKVHSDTKRPHWYRCRAPELRETFEQRHPHRQRHHLTLKRAHYDQIAQTPEAAHLGFHQASAVVAAPFLPDGVPKPLTAFERLIAHSRTHQRRLPRFPVLVRGVPRLRPVLSNRRMARLDVIRPVGADADHRFTWQYLTQQLGQHGRIAHAIVGQLDGPNRQRVGVYTQVTVVHLALLPSELGPVTFAFLLAFAQELDLGAVHQQIQLGGVLVGQMHSQYLLGSAHGAEVGHAQVQARQAQQAHYHARTSEAEPG